MKFPWRRRSNHELDEEIQAHLRMAATDRVERGVPSRDASDAARRELGNVSLVKETTREQWGWVWLEQIAQDVRYGARSLAKSPSFTWIAVLTLALGIGANTLVFSMAYRVLLQPLPYPSPERLVTLWESSAKENVLQGQASAANFYDWQAQNEAFSSMTGYTGWRFNLTGTPEPENILGALVTPEFFTTLGVRPAQGRTFLPNEDQAGKDDVVVVSDKLWARIFGAATPLAGQKIVLNRSVCTVVGVMPSSFAFPSPATEIWTPLSLSEADRQNRDGRWLSVIGRLKPEISQDKAFDNMRLIASRLESSYPKSDRGWSVRIVTLHDSLIGDSRTTLFVMQGAVGLLLLIACVNVAGLLMVRATGRSSEIAVRRAIGAGRGRVIRQLLTESALLTVIGALLGVLLADWGMHAAQSLGSDALPGLQSLTINGPVIAFTSLLSFVTIAVFGFVPAIRASSVDLYESLRPGRKGGNAGAGSRRNRDLLVAAQVGLAFGLLCSAGLLAKSFLRLTDVNPGFRVQNSLSMQISLPRSKYKTSQQQAAFFADVLDRIDQTPGVLAAGGVSDLPLLGNQMTFKILLRDEEKLSAPALPNAGVRWVTPGYFKAVGMTLRAGREFEAKDSASAPLVVAVSVSAARRFWPNQDPIGKQLRLEEDSRWFSVAGVVDDIKQLALDSDEGAAVYFLYSQKSEDWLNWMSIVVHTRGNPADLGPTIRSRIWSLDKDQPVTAVVTFDKYLADSVSLPRLRAIVMGSFSVLALSMAVVGILGMISYSVGRRTHEIGIRMALGARPGEVLLQFMWEGARSTVFGLALGVVAALMMSGLTRSLLFGVSALDPLTYAEVALVSFVASLAACYIPARRATRVDPIVALRYE